LPRNTADTTIAQMHILCNSFMVDSCGLNDSFVILMVNFLLFLDTEITVKLHHIIETIAKNLNVINSSLNS
jgi:hypothetical protein